MAARCRCCAHPRRAELDAQLTLGIPMRIIAKRFDVSIQSAHRHRSNGHVPKHIVDLMRQQRDMRGVDLELLRRQVGDGALYALSARKALLDQQLREVAGAGPSGLVALLAREAREHDVAICRITGEVAPAVHQHVHAIASAEWLQIRAAILRRARAKPELRAELLDLLEEVEGSRAHVDGAPGGGRLIEAPAEPAA